MATSPHKLRRLETSEQRRSHSQPRLHEDILVDKIFTRLPAAAAVRFRAVCRAWNAALTSDHFTRARAAARQPEIVFFVPPAAAGETCLPLYTCTLRNGAARELLSVRNLTRAEHAVLSPRPCRGLTLLNVKGRDYYVCNLTTGEHVALPPCEPAAAVSSLQPLRIGMGFHPRLPPWLPFQLESTGLGFDHDAGEHKVVRLFKDPGNSGQTARCEVCTVPSSARRPIAWRPCAGRVPPHAAGFVASMPPVFVDGRLYWLLEVRNHSLNLKLPGILSLSMDAAEQFELVQTPPARRVCHLTDLDGCLCAVVDVRHEINKYVFFTRSSTGGSWSVRCCIDLDGLVPRAVSDEFVEERDVVPLCSAGGKVLLATGRHKVFAYDPGRRAMERVFYAQEFVDVPRRHRDVLLRLSIVLHEEGINQPKLQVQAGNNKVLQVKLGSSTVAKRDVVDEHRDDRYRHLRDLFKQIAGMRPPLPPHMTNHQPNHTTTT